MTVLVLILSSITGFHHWIQIQIALIILSLYLNQTIYMTMQLHKDIIGEVNYHVAIMYCINTVSVTSYGSGPIY